MMAASSGLALVFICLAFIIMALTPVIVDMTFYNTHYIIKKWYCKYSFYNMINVTRFSKYIMLVICLVSYVGSVKGVVKILRYRRSEATRIRSNIFATGL